MKPIRAAIVSVVPSPYQRDLFRALAAKDGVNLDVYYMENSAPDSPWPRVSLASYERRLPGFWFPLGPGRVHVNWHLPNFRQYDLVILNTLMSITAQRLMRALNSPWAFWGERLGPGGRLHAAFRRPLQHARGIAGVGRWAVQDYQERFPRSRHFNIPYHCDLARFMAHERHSPPPGSTTFLFCGQMIRRKGVDVLLGAFSNLPSSASLLLVGREAELPEMLAALPRDTRDRVRYAGFQAPERLPHFFAQADVFVLPSRHDGWGVVVNQALGAGMPIICSTRVGAGHDLVEEDVNGLKFEPDDLAALEACMRRFIDHPELIGRFGAESRRRAEEWSPAAGARKWVQAMRDMLTPA